MDKLPILQKTYDFVKHYIPIINRLPKQHKYALGERLTTSLYALLEGLIQAQYEREKLSRLQSLNTQLEIIRYQTRLLHDFEMINAQRYEHIAKLINEIGTDLGGWIRQQRGKQC
jgi:four helix bundle protein